MTSYLDHNVVQDELFPGVPFTVIQTPAKAMVYFTTVVGSGFWMAPKSKYELPHLLEHLALEGSTTYPDDTMMALQLETVGVYHNAATSSEYNWYDISGPHAALELMQEHVIAQLYEPLFREEAIEQQKQVIHNELERYRSEDGQRVHQQLTQAIWGDRLVTMDQRLKRLPKITRNDIADYYRQKYVLRNMHFIVCGDLDATTITNVKKQFRQALKDKPLGEYQSLAPTPNRIAKQHVWQARATAADVTTLQLRFYQPELDKDTSYARRMLARYMSRGMGALLQRDMRKAGLTYSVDMFTRLDDEHSGFGVADKIPNQHVEAWVEFVARYLRDVADGKIETEAFERAKGMVRNSKESSFQKTSDFLNWYIDDLMVREELEAPSEYFDRMDAVTQEDMMAVVRKYLARDTGNWLIIMATQSKDLSAKRLEEIVDKYLV